MDLSPLWQIMSGYFTPLQLRIYVIIQMCIFVLLVGLARLFYPKENRYSIMTSTMSFLGSRDKLRNPKGWIFFNIAVFQITFCDIPILLYAFRYFNLFAPKNAWTGLIFFIISSVAAIIVSFVPDTEKEEHTGGDFMKGLILGRIHNIAAVITFLTFIAGNLSYGVSYFWHPTQRPIGLWLPPLLYFIFITICFFSTQIIWQIKCWKNPSLEPWPGDGILSFPLWEWILFVSLYIFIFWNIFII